MRAVVQAGWLTAPGLRMPAALGRGGVRPDKQEGDGATPAGLLPLRRVLYRAGRVRRPAAAVPVMPIAPSDGWCDDSADSAYNQFVTLPYPARHEALWRGDAVYDIIGVLGWNDSPVVRKAGSAIFLHVATPGRAPTEGCIALPVMELLTLLEAGLTEILVEP